ncbi:MAG: FAD-dependent oxidoreductase, partial [Phycisphaeraceae bacterium]|nr:FAD-dependent oxidoreductase [Phycisphaeraceae bacterium]
MSVDRLRVVIAGGGIAGIAAALRLADRGVAVDLLETRQRLGGRATSFEDPQSGRILDNCQHVVMRCCTNLLDLYERLRVDDDIVWT